MYVPPSDATNTGCTVHDALYAIGYPGPVFNHLVNRYIFVPFLWFSLMEGARAKPITDLDLRHFVFGLAAAVLVLSSSFLNCSTKHNKA